jgi:hypothetical protein
MTPLGRIDPVATLSGNDRYFRVTAVPGGGFDDPNPPFAIFCRRLDRCPLRADLCRSQAILSGGFASQSFRSRTA